MADDLAALLAGSAKTNANFDFGQLNKSYWQGLEEAYKQKQRDLFKDGVPKDDSGNIDWNAVSSRALQSGGASSMGEVLAAQKVLTDLGIKGGLQSMSAGIFGGQPQPSAPPAGRLPPSISGGGVRADDKSNIKTDNMEIPQRTIAAANAPQAVQPTPGQQAVTSAALPPPQQASPLVPRPVPVSTITPQSVAQAPPNGPQGPPMPPPRPPMQQAPPPQAQPLPTPPPPQQQPPVQQQPGPAVSPELEAGLREAGLLPEGRTLSQHVGLLQRAAALAQSTGVRDAGKSYIDALNNIQKYIEQRTAPTDLQKDYELDRRQGFRGTFSEWKNAKETNDARITIDKDTMKEISSQAAQMARVRPLLDEALRLSGQSYAGYAGALAPYWSKVVSSFGLNPGDYATNTEALRSIAQQLVPLVRQPGATSNYEAQLYLDAVISPTLSKEARIKVGNMIVKLVDRSQDVAKVYRQNIGSPDLYDKIAALDKPIFNPGERAFLMAAAEAGKRTEAPAATPTAEDIAAEVARRQKAGGR